MSPKVTLIQGGGMGLDQVPAVQRILAAAGIAIDWDEHLAGAAAQELGQPPLPPAMLDSLRRNRLALKTKLLPPATKPGARPVNYNVKLRQELGLFASVRPLKNLPGLPARFQGVDMLVLRELTEDLYGAIEHEIVPGVVQSIKVVTEAASRRFFQFAFDWARKAGRKEIACVHKANILKLSDGLFLDAFRGVAATFPDIKTRELIVDNCCMQMVKDPRQFDMLVMGNLYGDIVSDLAAGVTGGVSTTHGINVGGDLHVYESFHGGPREVVGVNRANPLPLLLPALDLAEALGHGEAGLRILKAVGTVLTDHKVATPDLGGTATTTDMADAIIKALP